MSDLRDLEFWNSWLTEKIEESKFFADGFLREDFKLGMYFCFVNPYLIPILLEVDLISLFFFYTEYVPYDDALPSVAFPNKWQHKFKIYLAPTSFPQ